MCGTSGARSGGRQRDNPPQFAFDDIKAAE